MNEGAWWHMDQVENKDRAENLQIGEICRCTERRGDCELEHILNIWAFWTLWTVWTFEYENFEHRIASLSKVWILFYMWWASVQQHGTSFLLHISAFALLLYMRICGSLHFVVFVYVYYFPVLQAGALWPGTWLGWMWLQFGLWRNPAPVTQCHSSALGLLGFSSDIMSQLRRKHRASICHNVNVMSISTWFTLTAIIEYCSYAWCIMNTANTAHSFLWASSKTKITAITSTHAVQAKRGGRAEWSKPASPNCSPIWVEQAA